MKEFPKLKNKLILAPMEEVSGLPFRLLCRRYGAALVYTEMVSSHGVRNDNKSTLKLIETSEEDKPVGIQFCGQLSDVILDAAKKVEKKFDLIDINMGCPSPNIIKQGAGSALLKRKNKIKKIIEALTQNLSIPVTAKIRSGYSKVDALAIAKVVENAGAAAVAVHARLAIHGSSVKADWSLIKKVKETVSIPVIGNGDVFTAKDAEEMLKHADYAMIARGAIRNPMIFKEALHYFKTGEQLKITPEEKIDMFFDYYELAKKHYYGGIVILKKRAQDFTHGLKNSTVIRDKISHIKTEEELVKFMEEYKKNLK